MTHCLLWCHSTNTLRVQTLDWLLAQGREAYTGNRPMGWVAIAQGPRKQMELARENCRGTLAGRHAELMREPLMVDLLDEPRDVREFCNAQTRTVAA